MIPARFLPPRLCRWLRLFKLFRIQRKARKWARIRQQDAARRRSRWIAAYLLSVNVKSEFPR